MFRWIVCIALCLGLTGCVNLKPKPDLVRLYTLGPVQSLPDKADVGQALYVARPELPEFLERNRLQYRAADGQLLSIDDARWGEPMEEAVSRAIAEYVSASEYFRAVGFYPWPQDEDAARLVVRFHRIDALADGSVQARAEWLVFDGADELASGRVRVDGVNWQVGKASSLVQAWNAVLEAVATEVVEGAGGS